MVNIRDYIISVRKHLEEKYGNVKPEWEGTLFILEDTLKRYIEIKESINMNGVYDKEQMKKNPLLSTEKDLVATILKISQKFSLSPWDMSKINIESESDEDDFIDTLVS